MNVLIDRNNCGMVGNICNDSYISCSGGVCSTAPAVQLYDPIIVWMGALNGSTEFAYFDVTLPFNITFYNMTTDNVAVSTSGVSFLFSVNTKKQEYDRLLDFEKLITDLRPENTNERDRCECLKVNEFKKSSDINGD